MSARVLIAGCGRIGTRLGQRFAAAGDSVWGLRRRAEPLPHPLNTLRGDLTHPRGLPSPPRGLDRVYFLATPGAYNDEAYRRTYVEGLANLIDWLANAGRPRLTVVSSTGVYGQSAGEWVDEDSPTLPGTFSGQRLLEAEGLAQSCPLETTVVRFAGIYGGQRSRMLDKVQRGDACVADPPRYTNRIHEDDCVGFLAHLADLPAWQPVYLGVDDAPCTQCELMDYIAEQLGAERPPRVTAADGRGAGKRCDNRRLKATGYRLQIPSYREGYAAQVRAAPGR